MDQFLCAYLFSHPLLVQQYSGRVSYTGGGKLVFVFYHIWSTITSFQTLQSYGTQLTKNHYTAAIVSFRSNPTPFEAFRCHPLHALCARRLFGLNVPPSSLYIPRDRFHRDVDPTTKPHSVVGGTVFPAGL